MRDYNFRKSSKIKEQRERKIVYKTKYFPTMPKEIVGDNGELHYVEGSRDNRKQSLKKVSNKKVRRSPLEETKDGRHYKKIYELQWNWY